MRNIKLLENSASIYVYCARYRHRALAERRIFHYIKVHNKLSIFIDHNVKGYKRDRENVKTKTKKICFVCFDKFLPLRNRLALVN